MEPTVSGVDRLRPGPLWRAAAGADRAVTEVNRTVQRIVRRAGDRRASAGTELPGGVRRIYHHHVRKTGGTSLNRAFLGLGGEDPARVHWRMRGALHATRSGGLVFVAHDRTLLQAGHYFYGWDHVPAWSVELPPHTFSLTVLRDPVARLVSLYRYLADQGADDHQPFKSGRSERKMAAGGFARFLDLLPVTEALKQLHTFSADFSVAEAADRVRACSAWFMTEEYDDGIDDLARRLELELPHRWDRRSRGETDVVGRNADRLAELLSPEYELVRALRDDPGCRVGRGGQI